MIPPVGGLSKGTRADSVETLRPWWYVGARAVLEATRSRRLRRFPYFTTGSKISPSANRSHSVGLCRRAVGPAGRVLLVDLLHTVSNGPRPTRKRSFDSYGNDGVFFATNCPFGSGPTTDPPPTTQLGPSSSMRTTERFSASAESIHPTIGTLLSLSHRKEEHERENSERDREQSR